MQNFAFLVGFSLWWYAFEHRVEDGEWHFSPLYDIPDPMGKGVEWTVSDIDRIRKDLHKKIGADIYSPILDHNYCLRECATSEPVFELEHNENFNNKRVALESVVKLLDTPLGSQEKFDISVFDKDEDEEPMMEPKLYMYPYSNEQLPFGFQDILVPDILVPDVPVPDVPVPDVPVPDVPVPDVPVPDVPVPDVPETDRDSTNKFPSLHFSPEESDMQIEYKDEPEIMWSTNEEVRIKAVRQNTSVSRNHHRESERKRREILNKKFDRLKSKVPAQFLGGKAQKRPSKIKILAGAKIYIKKVSKSRHFYNIIQKQNILLRDMWKKIQKNKNVEKFASVGVTSQL